MPGRSRPRPFRAPWRRTSSSIGPWDERLQRGEDTEQSARLRAAGYQVHILAAHTVQVDFNRVPIDTLRKCFLTGVWRHRTTPPPLPIPNERNASVPRRAMRRLRRVSRSWMAADRARRGGSSWRSFAWYLPWMTLFETAVRAGALWSSLTAPRGLASTSRAATEAPVRQ